MESEEFFFRMINIANSLSDKAKNIETIAIGGIIVISIIGITIIINQIKIKKMLRKLSEEKDKP